MEGGIGCESIDPRNLQNSNQIGILITVRDPSGNERELGFDAAGISSDPLQPTEPPAKMARVDLNAPEVRIFTDDEQPGIEYFRIFLV